MHIKYILLIASIVFSFVSQAQTVDPAYKKYHVEGSIVVFDVNRNKWFFSDRNDAYKGILPASTFKIVNSCIALQTRVVDNEHEVLSWDKKIRTFNGAPVAAWNKDTDMQDAFRNSTVWFYVEMAKSVGRARYREILHDINYGNNDFSEKGIDFWNYGNFKVTPVQQILFLKNLYYNKLPFDTAVMHTVKNIMLSDSTETYTIRSKSGWTQSEGKDIGWYVGWLTVADNVYFFANRLIKPVQDKNDGFSAARKNIVIDLFRNMKIIR